MLKIQRRLLLSEMMGISTTFILLCFAYLAWARTGPHSINHFVVNVSEELQDPSSDTKQFVDAWNAACATPGNSTVTIPAGKTITLNPVTVPGNCKCSNIHLQVLGNITAPGIEAWNGLERNFWITINDVTGLTIDGPGHIDGRGSAWWACRAQGQCSTVPIAFSIRNCRDVRLRGLKLRDSANMHVSIYGCTTVHVSQLSITAPGDSPNTDGIHIQESQQVRVLDSTIGTGDDCISIGTGTSDVNISYITCGPGHGISIGSLGDNSSRAIVSQIRVSKCKFDRTTNGARIKTWQGGSGYARDITFEQLQFTAVFNPIIIDQYYCDGQHNCSIHNANVQVSNVQFIGLQGSTSSDVAINLSCSQTIACTGIFLDNVWLASTTQGKNLTSYCLNAHGKSKAIVIPRVPCLS